MGHLKVGSLTQAYGACALPSILLALPSPAPQESLGSITNYITKQTHNSSCDTSIPIYMQYLLINTS